MCDQLVPSLGFGGMEGKQQAIPTKMRGKVGRQVDLQGLLALPIRFAHLRAEDRKEVDGKSIEAVVLGRSHLTLGFASHGAIIHTSTRVCHFSILCKVMLRYFDLESNGWLISTCVLGCYAGQDAPVRSTAI